ncbi:hypothetical protein [Agromyces sp. ZXT2-3]|uniref:hypothetical protein n=1 Tax=Agromyces sp. ZXT2-3 TaxID=3461152 RepID=UPI004054E424
MLSGLIGAAIGAAASIVAAILVLRTEKANRAAEGKAELRRITSVAFARDAINMQECAINQRRNLERFSVVESSLRSSLALFQAQMVLPQEAAVSTFAEQLAHSARFAMAEESRWTDPEVFRKNGVGPLLRWSSSDPTFPPGWFKAHVASNSSAFNQTMFDLEPDEARRAMN